MELRLSLPSHWAGEFLTVFDSHENCQSEQGGMIFTTIIVEGHDFYSVNEYVMYFGVKFGSESPPC